MSDSEEDEPQKPLKLAVIGNGTCGKTTLVNQFVHGSGSKDYHQTLGVEFYLKHVSISGRNHVSVQVWDIGGQTLGGKMLDKYIFGAHGVLLVYDIMNQNSFDDLEDWLQCVRHVCSSRGIAPHMALVANKCDMEHFRAVPVDKHKQFSEFNCLSSHCVSAKTGESVNLCFQKIVASILGVHLTKADQDEQQVVVKAEIVAENPGTEEHRPPSNASRLCLIQ